MVTRKLPELKYCHITEACEYTKASLEKILNFAENDLIRLSVSLDKVRGIAYRESYEPFFEKDYTTDWLSDPFGDHITSVLVERISINGDPCRICGQRVFTPTPMHMICYEVILSGLWQIDENLPYYQRWDRHNKKLVFKEKPGLHIKPANVMSQTRFSSLSDPEQKERQRYSHRVLKMEDEDNELCGKHFQYDSISIAMPEISIDDLYISMSEISRLMRDEEEKDQKGLSPRERTTFRHLVGALFTEWKETFPEKTTQTQLIEELADKYGEYRGLSASNLRTLIPDCIKAIDKPE